MSTIISLWLGIAFLVLGVAAVVIQAVLWNPDKYWDPVKKKTHAPKLWLNIHKYIGYTFGAIYVVMMWQMVPRLWEYQVELPARTMLHATAAIILGVLLIVKIIILKFFRYFEEAMPQIGLGILICTVLISVLSIPHAVRGTGLVPISLDAENRERVARVLSDIKFDQAVVVNDLVSDAGLKRGREVLAKECVRCHDMRTILAKPRSGANWYKVIDRMLDKPSIFDKPLNRADVPYVTAFMISITPNIQESSKVKLAQVGDAKITESKMDAKLSETEGEESEIKAPELPAAEAKLLYQKRCIDCHTEKEVLDHGGDTEEGWAQVVRRMVVEQEMVISGVEAIQVSKYLATTFPMQGKSKPVAAAPKPVKTAEPVAAGSAESVAAAGSAATAPPPAKTAAALVKPSSSAEAAPAPTNAPTTIVAAVAPKPAAAPTYNGPAPCTATSFATSTVRNACQRGGRPEARSLMRALMNKGKEKGLDFKCSSCHTDQSNYGLLGNATADLRKLF
ncbi:MAG TPA: hypothetical protein PK156_21685 [Polyangium sp.]|nr:hypothetical protein [Polyangium sp.]